MGALLLSHQAEKGKKRTEYCWFPCKLWPSHIFHRFPTEGWCQCDEWRSQRWAAFLFFSLGFSISFGELGGAFQQCQHSYLLEEWLSTHHIHFSHVYTHFPLCYLSTPKKLWKLLDDIDLLRCRAATTTPARATRALVRGRRLAPLRFWDLRKMTCLGSKDFVQDELPNIC